MQEYSRGTAISDPQEFCYPAQARDLREDVKDLQFSFWMEQRFSAAITTREGIGLSR
jgi:hypothetical protein